MIKRKRYGRTLLTVEEVRVIDALLKYKNVTTAAKVLGKAQPTVSIVKKKIEDKIDTAIETLKFALEKGLISVEDILDILSSTELYRTLKERAAKGGVVEAS